MAYQLGSAIYRTKPEMLGALVWEWLSADGMNGRDDILGLLAMPDKELAAECIHDWGLDRSERGAPSWMLQRGITSGDIAASFAKLRAEF